MRFATPSIAFSDEDQRRSIRGQADLRTYESVAVNHYSWSALRVPAMPTSRTIPGLLDELAARFPRQEALVGDGRRYTYAALRAEVRAFAKGLHALGVRKGDPVAILMGNKPEWIIADLAI